MMNTDRAGFLRKNLGGLKFEILCQNLPFLEVFRLFLEIYAQDFLHTATKCGGKCCGTNAEDRTSGKNLVLEIFIHKGQIRFQKRGLQKAQYLENGKCYQNLI